MSSQSGGLRAYDLLSVCGMALAGMIALVVVNFAPGANDAAVALVFAPWTSAGDALSRAAAADAVVVSTGRYPFIVIVRPAIGNDVAKISRSGAWLALSPNQFTGCGASRGQTS